MYSFDSRVRYSEVGADGKMSLCSVIHYMQDCSIFQSEDLGVGIAGLKQEKKAWLLSSWQIEIGRRPRLGERLTVGTWASGFKAMYGYRNFILRDESGDDAVRAASIWIYMNLETGRPEKVDDFVAEIYRPEPALEMEKAGRKIAVPDGLREYPAFPVQKYQIDTNGHVNNGQYLQMAEAWLPEDEQVEKLRVEYRKAAVYGDMIVPAAGLDESGASVVALKGLDGDVFAVIQAKTKQDHHEAE